MDALRYFSDSAVDYRPSTSDYRKRRKQEGSQRKKARKKVRSANRKQERKELRQRKRLFRAKRRREFFSKLSALNPFRKLHLNSLGPNTVDIIYRVVLSLSILLAVAFASLAFFRIRTIEVIGCAKCSPVMVAEASDVDIGDRLFFNSRKKIADGILEKLPYADSVRVHRKFPSTLSLEITETTPVGSILCNNVSYLINSRCKLLEYYPADSDTSSLVIDGLEVGVSVPGQEIVLSNQLYADSLSTLLQALEDYDLLDTVSRINMTKLYNISFLYDNRISVEIGDVSSLERKLELFQEVHSRLGTLVHGTLDLSDVGRATFSLND